MAQERRRIGHLGTEREQRNRPDPEESATDDNAVDAYKNKLTETYRWWDNLATINAEDPFLVGAAKIGVRVLGIIILLAMSPFILLGLIMAFVVVA